MATRAREPSDRPERGPSSPCPVETTLGVIGGKWKAVILFWLNDGTRRFSALRRAIPGVSERMLAQQLRELERDGVVRREVYPEVPPRVEYSLTAYGQTLRPITQLMCAWGQARRKRLASGRSDPETDDDRDAWPPSRPLAHRDGGVRPRPGPDPDPCPGAQRAVPPV
jgi:DNA-binding HxlR family transcriptional regulator